MVRYKISSRNAARIREGIEYATQVINKERTTSYAPEPDDVSLYARGYRHTVNNSNRKKYREHTGFRGR